MRPPHVSDAQVLTIIRDLSVGTALPAGEAVRRALQVRFGRRGGVARIYRLLAAEQSRISAPPPGSIESLQQDLHTLRARAERAEERERAHQTRWLMEIDRLRQRLKELEPLAARQGQREPTELLRQQLWAAEQRAADLETQLLEHFGHSHRGAQPGAMAVLGAATARGVADAEGGRVHGLDDVRHGLRAHIVSKD
jgi:hypothetical protein